MINAEQLRQYLYCPRKIYWRDVAHIQRSPTYLMDHGTQYHQSKVTRGYKHKNALRTYREFFLQSNHFKGIADAIVEYETDLIVIEYKHSIPIPIPLGYEIQIAALGVLAEEHFQKPVRNLEFRTHGGKREIIPLTDEMRKNVTDTVSTIEHLIQTGTFPDSCGNPRKCNPCEYNNICSTDL